jgi:hypothetical protein
MWRAYPFLAKQTKYYGNGANLSSYSFLNCYINGTSATRRVLVFVAWYSSSPTTLTSFTINGAAATNLYTSPEYSTGISIYIATVTSGNTCDIAVGFGITINSCAVTVSTLYANASNTPHDSATATSSTSGVDADVPIDIPNHGVAYCVSSVGYSGDRAATMTGVTETTENFISATNSVMGYTNWLATESNRDIGCNWNITFFQRTVALSFI